MTGRVHFQKDRYIYRLTGFSFKKTHTFMTGRVQFQKDKYSTYFIEWQGFFSKQMTTIYEC